MPDSEVRFNLTLTFDLIDNPARGLEHGTR
jgi:hypothetical protein